MNEKIQKDNIYGTTEQLNVRDRLGKMFEESAGTIAERLGAFTKYVTRQDISLFLARYELFKRVLDVKGSIVECGVFYGNGLMTWAQLSAALEPINYNRRIIGFDTFEGNASTSAVDALSPQSAREGLCQPDYAIDSEFEIKACINVYDSNRFLNHIPKVETVRGDIVHTVPQYLEENPHLMISLLDLSVNLHKPTSVALRSFLPRMSKGSIVAIHTLNEGVFPGATLSLLEELNMKNVCVNTFSYVPNLAYIIL